MATPHEPVLGGAHQGPSAEDRLRALVASAPVGIYEVTLDGERIYTNPHARRMASLPPGVLNRRAWLESLHPEDRAKVEREWESAIAEDRVFELEYRFLNPDGTVVWVAGRGTAMRGAEGQPRASSARSPTSRSASAPTRRAGRPRSSFDAPSRTPPRGWR